MEIGKCYSHLQKKNDKQLVKNYRPISLLPICSKLFEKMIFTSLYSYLNNNSLITQNQSGFRPGYSTTNQFLFLVNEIHEAFEDPKSLEVRAVFLDISKAFDKVWHEGLLFDKVWHEGLLFDKVWHEGLLFDKVWHEGLLFDKVWHEGLLFDKVWHEGLLFDKVWHEGLLLKLKQNGISGKLLTLFESYLHNRKQRVALNVFFSEHAHIESGVPQGSVLGPLLFLIYINDLQKNIMSNVKFFADDTMLFSVIKDPQLSATDLNHDIEVINQWAFQWKTAFNPDPTKQATEILFTCKKRYRSS